MHRRPLATVGLYTAAAAVTVFSAFPFVWMLLTSFKPRAEIFTSEPVFWPSAWEFSRYVDILTGGFARFLLNSTVVATATVVIGVSVASLAGYALARFDMPLRRYFILLILSVQMFPLVVLIIPLFVVMRTYNLLDSYVGLVIAYLAFTTPLAIWMLRGFFEGIPEDIEEAAMVDGATRMGAVLRVVLPLAGPGIAATSIFVLIAAWNEFLFALTFLSDEEMRTLPVALVSFMGRAQADWGAIMAASVLFTLPVVIFFIFVHRRLTEGMVGGAVKG